MKKDYYKILGVEKDATPEDIKKAYRSLAKQWHPDVSSEENANEKFKEINEAFSVIGDEEKRKEYDLGANFNFRDSDLFSAFRNFFSDDMESFKFSQNTKTNINPNCIVNVEIDEKDASKDCEKNINYEIEVECNECNGTGGFDIFECTNCNGEGYETVVSVRGNMFLQQRTFCRTCNGKGRTIGKTCTKCSGRGRNSEKKNINITIPKGSIGKTILIRDKGHKIFYKEPSGNLLITVVFSSKDCFLLSPVSGDIGRTLFIDPIRAVVGGDVVVEDVEKNTNILTIGENAKPGTRYLLKNKGVFGHNGKRGALIYELRYKDIKLDHKQKKILNSYLKTIE
jgi:molecular chaperone DnaJ